MLQQPQQYSNDLARLPTKPVDRIIEPLARFLRVEAASGVLLLFVTCIALALANSPFANAFLSLWQTPFGFTLGPFEMNYSLRYWINEGLMTIFFFVVGLEVKRELVLGELRDLRTASLPIIAAVGGMVIPASLYLAGQLGQPGERGWGIPMATDIAFVVGCLAVLGTRVPPGLRIVLLSLAIADDIGAILVIAIGYTSHLNLTALLLGLLGLGVVRGLTRLGVRSVPIYCTVGVLIWLMFHTSGVHATIAGVILGLLAPAHGWISAGRLDAIVQQFATYIQGERWNNEGKDRGALRAIEVAARETLSPLERLETALHPWVSFVIMPLFALANAGISINVMDFREPVAVAVMVGLGVGKPVGIVSFSWLAVRLGIAKLPEGVNWSILTAGGILAGIGFTMALFIAGLALEGMLLNAAKVGILSGSALCAVIGSLLLLWLLPKPVSSVRRTVTETSGL
ncbi:Na+/H+ antiporter NhaA [Candidatus Methylomirabilis sp.]|uniref:Na+/H+ antiporter NhaA n=1 Tax=Candidatus Methylomirabilis sp. TaxID=2032687 RepID=UPI002A686880|nr:Na+/H+ antiporter NhaA [Candidatus Methylomirabilis sp.]